MQFKRTAYNRFRLDYQTVYSSGCRQLGMIVFLLAILGSFTANAFAQTTLDITISTGNDDGIETSGGSVNLSDDRLDLGEDAYTATRFQNVTIPCRLNNL
ncbi:MAG: hypothetical protein ACKVH8_04445 [Pirellulales bacterium]